jgi:hypothetical protein
LAVVITGDESPLIYNYSSPDQREIEALKIPPIGIEQNAPTIGSLL